MRSSPWQPGDLATLVDPARLAGLLDGAGIEAGAVTATYLRLKPGVSAVIGLTSADAPDEARWLGYVRTFSEPDRADRLAAKWERMRPLPTPLGAGVRRAGTASVCVLFPNDAHLRPLRTLLRMDKVKRVLTGVPSIAPTGWRVLGRRSLIHPVSYRPERRLVAKAHLRVGREGAGRVHHRLYVRCFSDRRAATLAGTLFGLRGAGVLVPRPLAVLFDGRVLLEEEVVGEDGVVAAEAGRLDPDALAAALLRLHRSSPPAFGTSGPDDLLARCTQALGMLTGIEPQLEPLAASVRRGLAERLPAPAGPVAVLHGDLHLHQLVLTADGPAFVDLDRARLGHPFEDLGHLLAHLEVLGHGSAGVTAAQLRDVYLGDAGRVGSEPQLNFFTAAALVEHALLRVRRLEQDWPDKAAVALARADTLLAGSTTTGRPEGGAGTETWEILYPRRSGLWPAQTRRGAALYDPVTGRLRPARPDEDRRFPALADWVRRGELVAYRPGRRAVVRCEVEGELRYVKVLPAYRADRAAAAARAVTVCRHIPSFPSTPRLLERPEPTVLVFDALHGRLLREVTTRAAPADDGVLDAVAGGLVAFHRAPAAELPLPVPEERGLEEWVAFVAGQFSDMVQPYEAVLATLPPAPTDAEHLVHGDVHDGNVVIDGDGIGLLDLDSLHPGHPAEDVGNLAAHLILRSLQRGTGWGQGRGDAERLISCYLEAGGRLERAEVLCCCARVLFRLACAYRFRRRWQWVTPHLLEGARLLGKEAWR